MRLICVPRPTLLITTIITFALLFHIAAAQQKFIDTEELTQQHDIQQESNIDDTSLFRGVENAIDEDSEDDDAYRILKSLQDVTEDDFSEEDEEEEEIDHNSSKEIKERIQPEENDNDDDDEEEDTTEVNMEEVDDDDEEEKEEEDDDDFSPDSFPDFKNEVTTDFFEHLPQQPLIPEKGIDSVEEEEADEDDIVDNHNDIHEEEYTDDEEEDEKVIHNNNIPNKNNVPVLPPTTMHDNTIPWHRAGPLDKVIVDDNKFYQDTNYNYSYEKAMKKQRSTASFRLWHGILILLILVIVYKSSNKKSHHILDSNNSSSSLPWNNEKDYLPLHNNKGNRHHKWEIKSC